MARQTIKLGDDIEDVTAKATGIAIGRVEYLDGSVAWLMQPKYGEDGTRIPIIEVQDAYARRIGEGVYVEPKQQAGFHAREV
jgi:hypothetical protein